MRREALCGTGLEERTGRLEKEPESKDRRVVEAPFSLPATLQTSRRTDPSGLSLRLLFPRLLEGLVKG